MPVTAPGYCHSPPTGTRTTPEHGITRPTTTTPGPSGTKLSLLTRPRRMCGTKLSQQEPHGPTSGTKLSPLAQNGPIWRFLCMQGEFCTVLTTKKPSRENFVPNTRQRSSEPTQQHSRRHRCEAAGGRRRNRRARPRCRVRPVDGASMGWRGQRQTNFAHNFPRSLFKTAQKRCNSNDANSMFEKVAGELRAKLLCRRARPRYRWAPTGPQAAAGPGRASRRDTETTPHTHFAHNFPRSLLEIAQKRCNSNDMNSIFEALAGELRAELLSDRAWPGFETTHTPISTPRATGVEGAGGSGGHGRASRRGAERSEALASRAAGPDSTRNTSGATLWRWGNRTPVPRHSKRGRREPTPCASALTHP